MIFCHGDGVVGGIQQGQRIAAAGGNIAKPNVCKAGFTRRESPKINIGCGAYGAVVIIVVIGGIGLGGSVVWLHFIFRACGK